MYLRVFENGELALKDCDNLRAFSIVAESVNAPFDQLLAFTTAAEDNHYWLRVEAVEQLSPRHDDQQWISDFRAMLASVAGYGYYDERTNRVKAHVELLHDSD